MKRLISLIIAGLMTMSLCANTALAADSSSIKITKADHNILTDSVVLEVEVTSTRGNVPLTLVVTDEDGNTVYAEADETSPITADTNVSTKVFNIFRFLENDMTLEGNYLFTVYARYLNDKAERTIPYFSGRMWFDFLKNVNTYKGNYDSVEDLTGYLNSNTVHTLVGYTELSSSAKGIVARYLMNDEYELPEGMTEWPNEPNETQKTTLQNAIQSYKDAFNEGLNFANLYDSYVSGDKTLSKSLFYAWYDANKATLEAEDSSTSFSEVTFMGANGVFQQTYNDEKFYKRLPYVASQLAVHGSTVMQEEIINAIILTKVENNANGTVLGTFIAPYASDIGIDIADNLQKGIDAVAGKYYGTMGEFVAAVISAGATDSGDDDNDNDNYGNGGSTSTKSDTGSTVTGVVNVGQGTPVGSGEAPFEDIESHAWAKEAIDFLYRRSIISGRDEKTFDPAGAVTRAEFIKMLVATYNFAVTDYSDYRFNDIVGGEWFAIYVKKAAAMGVITGDENGNFNPNAQITREDMAVTIYRASDFAEATAAPVFGDAANISDYAKSAVATLHENGIVSGMGDLTFAPKKNVTRAEAAQILYNVLIRTIK